MGLSSMANDKDFILKNAVEVGGPTNVTLGTVTSDNIDLSTGNYFKDTPTGNSTYSISNAGDVQSFQLEVTGGLAEVAQNFSTTLYTGNGSTQTITNGIDLAGDGGLVWVKSRNYTYGHALSDTEHTVGNYLQTNTTNPMQNGVHAISAFSSDGFSLGNDLTLNDNNSNIVAWTFKKAAKFFDVVTYTGNGTSGRTVSHSLGSVPGMILIKKTSGTADWIVYHRSEGATKYLELNNTNASATYNMFDDTDPTSTEFSVSSYSKVNDNGATYVAYLFAHDTAADSQIKCGSYTGKGSTNGPEIDLGWEPQWVLIKAATRPGGENWVIYDNKRGIVTGGGDPALFPSDSAAEDFGGSADDSLDVTSTGFKIVGTSGRVNDSYDYIYMAIRAPSEPDITWPSSIEWAGGVAPSAPAVGETDVFTITTDDGGTSYVGVKTADNLS